MFVEVLIAGLVLAAFLLATYVVALIAVRLFAITSDEGRDDTAAGEQSSSLIDAFTKSPHQVLLAADLFRSLALLLETAIIAWAVPRWSAQLGMPWLPATVIALAVIWILHMLVAEILPKSAALESNGNAPEFTDATLASAWFLLWPFVAIAKIIVRKRPVVAASPEEREEIVERALESLAESAGVHEPLLEEDEREMIQGVIGLEDTEVRELMVPRINIVAVDATASVEDVRRLTTEWGHSRLPVFDGDLDSIIGILYVKDLFCAPHEGAVSLATLARRAFVVPETKKVDALLEEFKRRRAHIAIVADEFGGTAGLITLEDILEEIVGEIEDEHDRGRRHIEPIGEGAIRVDGVVPLSDIADALEIDLPEQKFETIGGLIYDRVGGVPEVGRTITDLGLTLTIEEMDGQRIRRVRVSRVFSPSPRSD
ncbi:MAG: HlyC/CorC family transporter [candidate division Zixibacteria bacterium]|nr:HlyC/CorC family transporter [candidate division Zixibacteria bacterium]